VLLFDVSLVCDVSSRSDLIEILEQIRRRGAGELTTEGASADEIAKLHRVPDQDQDIVKLSKVDVVVGRGSTKGAS
jgi:hypothetical protein